MRLFTLYAGGYFTRSPPAEWRLGLSLIYFASFKTATYFASMNLHY